MREARLDDLQVVNLLWLSHHGPLEEDRCIVTRLKGKPHLLCARCTGIVVGMVCGAALWTWEIPTPTSLWLLPVPAFADWTAYLLNLWRGTNTLRLVNGFLLGLAYVGFLFALLRGSSIWVLFPAMFFCVWFAGVLSYKRWRLHRLLAEFDGKTEFGIRCDSESQSG